MLKQAAMAFQEIVFPCYCLICRKRLPLEPARGVVCGGCMSKIIPNTPPFCLRCGRKIAADYSGKTACGNCREDEFWFDRAWASCLYEGVVKEMIHKLKYNNKIPLALPLSGLLTGFIRDYHLPVTGCDYVIPIPLYPARQREREFNQAGILADATGECLNLKVMAGNLIRRRDTSSQASLSKKKRWQNMQGAFGLKDAAAVKEKTILLIDDVLTTGSTASEAARALKQAGSGSVFVLTVAH